jgi:hypothetical protein
MLRKIFRANKDGIIGDGENCIIRNLITSTFHQIQLEKLRKLRWVGHIACMGMRTAYGVFVGEARTKQTPSKT